MRKILFFIPTLGGGGAERVTVCLIQELVKRGLEVDMLLVKKEGPYIESLPESVRVFSFVEGQEKHKEYKKKQNILNFIKSIIGSLILTLKIRRHLIKYRPCIFISVLSYANIFALLAHKTLFKKMPIFVCEHSTASICLQDSPGLQQIIARTLMSFLYKSANGIASVSDGVSQDLKEYLKTDRLNIKTIYNPVVGDDLISKSAIYIKHPWLDSKDVPVFLAVGRLTLAKNYPDLFKAFACLRRQKSARLLILGEGELRPELEALARDLGIADDVDMPGFVDNPFAYMARCDCFVLSSRYEGLPTVLIEAMACGAPVVSTDCPSGPREILEGGKWGKLVPVGDAEALAAAMLDVLDNPPPSARARAMDFTVDKAVDAYLELLLGDEAGPYLTRARAA
jgi:glycosyltransferase involved in cell wall biosynthesis